jgi:hypothetical protein
LESESDLDMSAVLRRALMATMDITRMRARLTDITDLAISTAAYLSARVRGMAGVAADTGADAVTTADTVMATADAVQ